MNINTIKLIYRNFVSENRRIFFRNLQYICLHNIFLIKYFLKKLSKSNITKVKKNKIIFLIPTTNIAGGIAVICEHATRLKSKGYDVTIFTLDNKSSIPWFKNLDVSVKPWNGDHENAEIAIATGWITTYAIALTSAPRKYYFIQSDERRFYPINSYLRNRVAYTYKQLPFNLIVQGKWMTQWIQKEFNKKSIQVPIGLNKELFHPVQPLKAKNLKKPRVLVEGAINLPFKKVVESIEILQEIDCEIWCVSYDGRPPNNLRIDSFFEKVTQSQMPSIYSSCDFLLKLSTVEGVSMPPLEMMACGGIPIVQKVTGSDEYLIDKVNGFILEPQNYPALKYEISNIVSKYTNNQDILKNARNTANSYDWNSSNNKLEDTLIKSK
ncbi:MAG: glycosyltransferase family 4 protein [Candidatus Roizmanbacteria bacterium]